VNRSTGKSDDRLADGQTASQERRAQQLRLLWRIRRRYETVTEHLRFGTLTIAFVRVADPDRVLDQVAEEDDRREKQEGRRLSGDELHLPYWAELWDSALAVGDFLAAERGLTLLARCRQSAGVLDLGCGMGLAGTVAALLGGARVTLADLEPPALLFARLNSLAAADRVEVRRIDWRTADLKRRFGLIIGADILYDRNEWWFLEPFWRRHLCAGGTVLLGEPGRQTGDDFPEWIAQRGWHVEQLKQHVPMRKKDVRIFLLRADVR